MKFFRVLIGLVLLIAACNRADKKIVPEVDTLPDDYVKSPFDTNGILNVLFSPDTIVKKMALWTPDKDASYNMEVCDDGYCHTNIDTIIKMGDTDAANYLVVFTTFDYEKNGERIGCHTCGADYGMAVLEPQGKNYHVLSFKRNFACIGESGKGGILTLEKLRTDNVYVLHISCLYTGTSSKWCIEKYYELPNCTEVFTYESSHIPEYDSNATARDTADGYEMITRKLIEIIPKASDDDPFDYNLKLKCCREYYDTIRHKILITSYNEFYKMDDYDRYEKVTYSE